LAEAVGECPRSRKAEPGDFLLCCPKPPPVQIDRECSRQHRDEACFPQPICHPYERKQVSFLSHEPSKRESLKVTVDIRRITRWLRHLKSCKAATEWIEQVGRVLDRRGIPHEATLDRRFTFPSTALAGVLFLGEATNEIVNPEGVL